MTSQWLYPSFIYSLWFLVLICFSNFNCVYSFNHCFHCFTTKAWETPNFHTKLINIFVFLPTLKETDMSHSSTLHPKRPSFHRTQLPMHCTACLFLYSLVYHNSLFELESSNTVPTGKHQVINAIPGMLVWVIYAQTNVAPRLQVVLSAMSLCTSRQCFWWLHLRDLPKCVCFFPKVVSRVSALGLFTSKCFCDSPKQHESQCFLFPFYYFFLPFLFQGTQHLLFSPNPSLYSHKNGWIGCQ